MKKTVLVLAAAVSAAALFAADVQIPKTKLYRLYDKDFLIGVALPQHVTNQKKGDRAKLAVSQFNCVTPENLMKWDALQPKEEKFEFAAANTFVKFAQENKMRIHGHTLIWHSQTPDWVFQDRNGKPATRRQLLKRMEDHIFNVMRHFKGQIDAWDVVNEAFNDDGTLRDSKWKQIIGDDYIEYAFEYARLADPKAKLVYNDYNAYNPAKRKGILKLVKQLRKRGLIDAVGMQGHWQLNYPDVKLIDESIKEYIDAGVEVMITELDIDVLPSSGYNGADISQNRQYKEDLNPYVTGLPEEVSKKLADRYAEIFKVFEKYRKNIYSVTIWGLDDGTSWLNDFPVKKRTNYPVLFDRQLKAKPCYDALVELKETPHVKSGGTNSKMPGRLGSDTGS